MSPRHICALATDQGRFHIPTILLGFTIVVFAPAMAAEIITMEVESQALDLDAGTVADALTEDLMVPTGADVQLAYNADRTPHVVVFPVGEGVELAFVACIKIQCLRLHFHGDDLRCHRWAKDHNRETEQDGRYVKAPLVCRQCADVPWTHGNPPSEMSLWNSATRPS